ncbi:MAG: hypothetical protein ACXVXO_11135 [Mycobacteriaceae bacterium]
MGELSVMSDGSGQALAASSSHVVVQQTEWTQVKAYAAAGELRFEPGAAEACAAAYDKFNEHIDEQLHKAQGLFNVKGFGDTIVGNALSGKFLRQAEEAVKILTAHQALLTDMAWTYRQAGKNYAAADTATARGIAGLG